MGRQAVLDLLPHVAGRQRLGGNSQTGAVIPEFFSGLVSSVVDGIPLFNQGTVDWNLTYNTIDLELGRRFAVSESVWLRPSLGIKTAIIQQDVHLGLAHPSWHLSAEEDVAHDFWGIGPSFGVSGGWNIPKCSNLSVVGSFSADFLFGQWNVNDAYARTDSQLPLGHLRRHDDQHDGFVSRHSVAAVLPRSRMGASRKRHTDGERRL